LGIIREYKLTDAAEAVLQVRVDRQVFPPYGLYGGSPGAPAMSILNAGTVEERAVQGKFMMTLKRGQNYRAALPGGGGWGPPFEREPARVMNDVLNEKVSLEAARLKYGVVISPETRQVDETATAAVRSGAGRTP
jgi:N-methylhydantoinase B